MNIIKQKIQYDSASIIQQAAMYTDYYRVLAEYVDNSIDSAEAFYKNGVYSKKVEINIIMCGSRQEDYKIAIIDNCCGMEINTSEPYTIFRSNKKNDPNTNGMFGFGMFSFFSMCNRMNVSTIRLNSNKKYNFDIHSGIFNSQDGNDPSIEIFSEVVKGSQQYGTIITLSEFNEGVFEEINSDILQQEIEKHFELILNREGITVSIINKNNLLKICSPFEYSKYCKTPYVNELTELQKTHSKKNKSKKKFDISKNPAKVFLISSPEIEFNREPFFTFKGRRVVEVSKVDQFRSNKKFQIWSRSNVTGYIDITDVLTPTPSRNNFVRTELSKAFFQSMLDIEDEIIKYFETNVVHDDSKKLKKFENRANSAIKEFIYDSGLYESFSGDEGEFQIYKFKGYNINDERKALNKQQTKGNTKINSTIRIKKERNKIHEIRFPDNKSVQNNESNRLKFKIDSINEPHQDTEGKKLRSVLQDNIVFIFEKHIDFQKRLNKPLKNYLKFNETIYNYIALEYVTHLVKRIKNVDFTNHAEFVTLVLKLEEKFIYHTAKRV